MKHNKLSILLILLMAVIFAFSLTACNDEGGEGGGDITPVAITVTGISLPDGVQLDLLQGAELDLTGKYLIVNLSNGDSRQVELTPEMLGSFPKDSVGTHTVSITYEGQTITCQVVVSAPPVTIVPIQGAVIVIEGGNFVYTGSPIVPEFTVSMNSNLLTPSEDYTYEFTNNTVAGEARLTITGVGDYSGDKYTTFAIARKQVARPTAPANRTYDGTAQIVMTGTSDYNVANATQTNAGTYNATVTLTDPVNMGWAPLAPNGELSDEAIVLPYTITKKSIEKPSFGNLELTYAGTEQSFFNAVQGSAYVLSGAVSATDAGSYTATVALVDTVNHEWADGTNDSYPVSWSIRKATYAYNPIAADDSATFTGSNLSYNFNTENKPATVNVTVKYTGVEGTVYAESTLAPINAGKYRVDITFASTNVNYENPTALSAVWTINKLGLDTPAVAQADVLVFTGNPQNHNLPTGAWSYSAADDSQKLQATDAGSYFLTATLTDTDNYYWLYSEAATITATWSIAQADIDFGVTMADYNYNGEPTNPELSMNLTDERDRVGYAYRLKYADESVSWSTLKPVNAGLYEVKAHYNGAGRNYATKDAYGDFEVKQIALGLSVVCENVDFGTPVNPEITINAESEREYLVITYAVNDGNNVFSSTVPTAAGNYRLKVDYDGTGRNYRTVTSFKEFTINQVDLENFSLTIANVAEGVAIAPALVVEPETEESYVMIQYGALGSDENNFTGDKPTANGNYTAIAKYIGDGRNYKSATIRTNFSIGVPALTAFSISVADIDFGGSIMPVLTLDPSSENSHVTYQYKLSSANDASYVSNSPTDAGTYTVKAIYNGTNYAAQSVTDEFVIRQIEMPLKSFSVADLTYGEQLVPNCSLTDTDVARRTIEYKAQAAEDAYYSTEVPTTKGNYTARLSYDGAGNYLAFTLTCDFVIAPKNFADMDASAFVLSYTTVKWDGTVKQPEVTVTYLDEVLVAGATDDYAVSVEGNRIAPDTYTMTLTARGNFAGVRTLTYQITAIDISTATATFANDVVYYTGNAVENALTITFNSEVLDADCYTVVYDDNVNIGTVTATITGKTLSDGSVGYTGNLQKTFKIENEASYTILTGYAPTVFVISASFSSNGLMVYRDWSYNDENFVDGLVDEEEISVDSTDVDIASVGVYNVAVYVGTALNRVEIGDYDVKVVDGNDPYIIRRRFFVEAEDGVSYKYPTINIGTTNPDVHGNICSEDIIGNTSNDFVPMDLLNISLVDIYTPGDYIAYYNYIAQEGTSEEFAMQVIVPVKVIIPGDNEWRIVEPTKTVYDYEDTFSTAGLKVEIFGYRDETNDTDVWFELDSKYWSMASDFVLSQEPGNYEVRINNTYCSSYPQKSFYVERTDWEVTAYSVKTAPNKTQYSYGEDLDLTGLVLEYTVSYTEIDDAGNDIVMEDSTPKTATYTSTLTDISDLSDLVETYYFDTRVSTDAEQKITFGEPSWFYARYSGYSPEQTLNVIVNETTNDYSILHVTYNDYSLQYAVVNEGNYYLVLNNASEKIYDSYFNVDFVDAEQNPNYQIRYGGSEIGYDGVDFSATGWTELELFIETLTDPETETYEYTATGKKIYVRKFEISDLTLTVNNSPITPSYGSETTLGATYNFAYGSNANIMVQASINSEILPYTESAYTYLFATTGSDSVDSTDGLLNFEFTGSATVTVTVRDKYLVQLLSFEVEIQMDNCPITELRINGSESLIDEDNYFTLDKLNNGYPYFTLADDLEFDGEITQFSFVCREGYTIKAKQLIGLEYRDLSATVLPLPIKSKIVFYYVDSYLEEHEIAGINIRLPYEKEIVVGNITVGTNREEEVNYDYGYNSYSSFEYISVRVYSNSVPTDAFLGLVGYTDDVISIFDPSNLDTALFEGVSAVLLYTLVNNQQDTMYLMRVIRDDLLKYIPLFIMFDDTPIAPQEDTSADSYFDYDFNNAGVTVKGYATKRDEHNPNQFYITLPYDMEISASDILIDLGDYTLTYTLALRDAQGNYFAVITNSELIPAQQSLELSIYRYNMYSQKTVCVISSDDVSPTVHANRGAFKEEKTFSYENDEYVLNMGNVVLDSSLSMIFDNPFVQITGLGTSNYTFIDGELLLNFDSVGAIDLTITVTSYNNATTKEFHITANVQEQTPNTNVLAVAMLVRDNPYDENTQRTIYAGWDEDNEEFYFDSMLPNTYGYIIVYTDYLSAEYSMTSFNSMENFTAFDGDTDVGFTVSYDNGTLVTKEYSIRLSSIQFASIVINGTMISKNQENIYYIMETLDAVEITLEITPIDGYEVKTESLVEYTVSEEGAKTIVTFTIPANEERFLYFYVKNVFVEERSYYYINLIRPSHMDFNATNGPVTMMIEPTMEHPDPLLQFEYSAEDRLFFVDDSQFSISNPHSVGDIDVAMNVGYDYRILVDGIELDDTDPLVFGRAVYTVAIFATADPTQVLEMRNVEINYVPYNTDYEANIASIVTAVLDEDTMGSQSNKTFVRNYDNNNDPLSPYGVIVVPGATTAKFYLVKEYVEADCVVENADGIALTKSEEIVDTTAFYVWSVNLTAGNNVFIAKNGNLFSLLLNVYSGETVDISDGIEFGMEKYFSRIGYDDGTMTEGYGEWDIFDNQYGVSTTFLYASTFAPGSDVDYLDASAVFETKTGYKLGNPQLVTIQGHEVLCYALMTDEDVIFATIYWTHRVAMISSYTRADFTIYPYTFAQATPNHTRSISEDWESGKYEFSAYTNSVLTIDLYDYFASCELIDESGVLMPANVFGASCWIVTKSGSFTIRVTASNGIDTCDYEFVAEVIGHAIELGLTGTSETIVFGDEYEDLISDGIISEDEMTGVMSLPDMNVMIETTEYNAFGSLIWLSQEDYDACVSDNSLAVEITVAPNVELQQSMTTTATTLTLLSDDGGNDALTPFVGGYIVYFSTTSASDYGPPVVEYYFWAIQILVKS